jgi:hypothetical protein
VAGRYTCLGETIAFLELNKAIAEVSALFNLCTCWSNVCFGPDEITRRFFVLIIPFSNRRKGLRADIMGCSYSQRRMSSCSGAQKERVRILDEMRNLSVITSLRFVHLKYMHLQINNCRPKEFTWQIGYT